MAVLTQFEQTLGDGEGQGSRACCSPWGHKVKHDLVTEQHDNTSHMDMMGI